MTNYKFNINQSDITNPAKNTNNSNVPDLNKAVAEYVSKGGFKQESIPSFENNADGAKKASEWLNKNNSTHRFVIDCIDVNSQQSKESTSSLDKKEPVAG